MFVGAHELEFELVQVLEALGVEFNGRHHGTADLLGRDREASFEFAVEPEIELRLHGQQNGRRRPLEGDGSLRREFVAGDDEGKAPLGVESRHADRRVLGQGLERGFKCSGVGLHVEKRFGERPKRFLSGRKRGVQGETQAQEAEGEEMSGHCFQHNQSFSVVFGAGLQGCARVRIRVVGDVSGQSPKASEGNAVRPPIRWRPRRARG